MSGGYVFYNQRPNKAVERQLFVELLVKLNRHIPVSKYNYISFGGTYFEDFKLVHSYFANSTMVSIEEDANIFARQRFNKPLGCIIAENCTSDDFIINKFDKYEQNIIWLDYADSKQHQTQLGEFKSLLTKSNELDVIKITLNANLDTLFSQSKRKEDGRAFNTAELNQRRYENLKSRINNFLPNDIGPSDLAANRYPLVLNRAVGVAAAQAMSTMRPGLLFQPLTSFFYEDSINQMMTVTGIILKEGTSEALFEETALGDWELASTEWGKCLQILVPPLTVKEKLTLDQNIPCTDIASLQEVLNFKFDSVAHRHDSMLDHYNKYYRYYPTFHRVSY
ncbi:O-methyltransferase [Dyadobacter pollutisoli]|uniref:Uncharacterized protein n=1 Tax=Dyadobacter pollutisoli TaxID=2910158 RepID=A0A9E8NBE7_9BACT|nr:O-methyltransferase [Dyadobacter pollutisoli]WAC11229.1 hypothetical protein ON006_26285 [Dyadobacter pollutisoli]